MPDYVTTLMDVHLTKNAATITAPPVSLEDILKVISSDIESLESKILGDVMVQVPEEKWGEAESLSEDDTKVSQ